MILEQPLTHVPDRDPEAEAEEKGEEEKAAGVDEVGPAAVATGLLTSGGDWEAAAPGFAGTQGGDWSGAAPDEWGNATAPAGEWGATDAKESQW